MTHPVEIENCLKNLNDRQIQEDVERFVRAKGLSENESLFQLGALCAKDPALYLALSRDDAALRGELYEGLTADQSAALREEDDHIWRQPWKLYLTILVCAIGAMLQGWDQTGSNAANLHWPRELGLNEEAPNFVWVLGIVNACPYFAASLIGVWLCDPLNSFWGRKGVIFFSSVVCFASVIGSAFTQKIHQLVICRILLGIGMGSKATTIPIFAGESAPARIRGTLLLQWQLWVSFGIFLGFTANLAVSKTGHNVAWRLQLGSAFIPAVPLMLLVYWAPESPRWYIKRNEPGDYVRAFNSLKILRRHELLAARDLYFIHKQIEVEREHLQETLPTSSLIYESGPLTRGTNYLRRFSHLFSMSKHHRVRNATLSSGIVMLSQQLCGINVVAFFSSTLLKGGNISEMKSLWIGWGFGLVNFLFCLPAISTIDTWGRRAWLLFTIPNMAWTILAAGLAFKIKPDTSDAHAGVVAIFIFLFGAFYSPGMGPIPFTYSAEAFDLAHREVGMSFSVAINLFFAGIITSCFPRMNQAIGSTSSLGIFAAFNIIAFILVFLWVPETKRYTLEELDSIFKFPAHKHMIWQITTFLPAFIRKYILLRGNELPDLFVYSSRHSIKKEEAYSQPKSD